ncbi:hypothetical protein AA11825_0004 [Acetobacter pomorum DSM 11825]|nr:hypothetical protein AA11825_0004 [Acetobacter pomorum DSM 11825]
MQAVQWPALFFGMKSPHVFLCCVAPAITGEMDMWLHGILMKQVGLLLWRKWSPPNREALLQKLHPVSMACVFLFQRKKPRVLIW